VTPDGTATGPPVVAPSPETDELSLGERIVGTAVGDRIYVATITVFAVCVPLLLGLILWEVALAGWPAFREFGLGFVTSSNWDPVRHQFGASSAIIGTIVTSIVALIIATPLALGVSIFLSEYAPTWLRQPVAFVVDLLAAIPSVVYGLWGMFVLLPLLRQHVIPFMRDTLHLGVIPLFSGPSWGNSVFAASLILAIMVLPYISSVSREVLLAVPRSQREAALALGATRWEMIQKAVLPFAKSGIIGGIILGLGRALGETMAVTMVIGNTHDISISLFAPGYTMASLIANEFAEASGDLHLSALMAVGFILLVVALIVNALARWLVWQVGRKGMATGR
jgi:phosphate transport system permease protein